MIRLQLISVLSLIFFLSAFQHVSAQDKSGTLEIMPAFSEIEITKGESKKIPVTITNNDSKEITLELFPLDFKQQGENGDIAFLGKDQESYSYSLASFLSLESDNIIIAPRSSEEIVVTVQDREDLSPGGHYAALVARLVQDENPSHTLLSPSISSLILLKKSGGERYNISLLRSNWPKTFSFTYPKFTQVLFQNEGNVHLIPYGTFEVKDLFGRALYKGVLNSSSHIIFPESRRYITADVQRIKKSLPISFNLMTIQGNDSTKKITFVQRNTFVYVHPGFLLVLVGIGFLGVRLFKKLRVKK